MNRVEKFRQRRILTRGYITAILLFLLFLTSGILAVDHATNLLISGQQGIALAEVASSESSLEITVMNRKIYVNTRYINRDKLKEKLNQWFR